ncbi:acetyltransferase GCN5 [Aliidongia dinghuensis]|uniref:Acetyltransferase GCN5 n=1 Tax=Aliidongia dinghuensis TaxID=1867774 RepID=A0A8J2YY15_9PROT|nr:GNAT family N-acetyltransferase [Aliidongia dinghuensis]GGF38990.1 acetyltransferase GCN5 [Aliidongia dinghuensis]
MHPTIRIEDPAQPDIVLLLEHGEAHSAELYPAESNHHLPLDALRAANVLFHVARDAGGRAIGTGAVVLNGTWAEIKRMWVEPEARGLGLSKAILDTLEAAARAAGVGMLRLETGVVSHAALGLYARAGFVPCDPFADYRPDPLSVFMQKDLQTASS